MDLKLHFDCIIKRIVDSYHHAKCTPLSVLQSDHVDGHPLVYCTSDDKDALSTTNFYPAASKGRGDYSAVHFYAVTDHFVEAIYTKGDSRIDFPLTLWPDENNIIKKGQESPVLLLGRSGTGKTTCCLYQLWNRFLDYWKLQKRNAHDIPVEMSNKTVASEEENGYGIAVDDTPLSVITSKKYCDLHEGHLRQIFCDKK